MSDDYLLGVPDVAQETGLCVRQARDLFNKRRLPLVKIGRRLYVRRGDLMAYLDAATLPVRPADGTTSVPRASQSQPRKPSVRHSVKGDVQ